jgi:hypothetical protein
MTWLLSVALMMWLHFVKVVTVLCFAFCFERILGKMVNSVLLLVAWIERYFEVLLSTLNCVGVHTSSLIKTSNSALNSAVNATLSLETRYAAWQLITSFSFNPLSNDINQGLSAAVLYRNEKHFKVIPVACVTNEREESVVNQHN